MSKFVISEETYDRLAFKPYLTDAELKQVEAYEEQHKVELEAEWDSLEAFMETFQS